jgi:hypothetical protein
LSSLQPPSIPGDPLPVALPDRSAPAGEVTLPQIPGGSGERRKDRLPGERVLVTFDHFAGVEEQWPLSCIASLNRAAMFLDRRGVCQPGMRRHSAAAKQYLPLFAGRGAPISFLGWIETEDDAGIIMIKSWNRRS